MIIVKTTMKSLYLLISLLLIGSCAKANKNPQVQEPVLSQIQVSKLATTPEGKTYVEVDGKPFAFMGAQVRLDALMNCEQKPVSSIEPYFKKAVELGVNCLQIPICWRMIEPQKDQYDFSVIDAVMGYCNKYNIKMELLWFSTNMCGESYSYLTPIYILSDKNRRLARSGDGDFWGYYGYMYALILDDEYVLERETEAVTRLFNHIRYWDSLNGGKHPVITAQIHNEPDIFVRWRYEQRSYKYRDGRQLTEADTWKMIMNSVDAVGQAVQNSSYKVLTRVNLVKGDGIKPFPEAPSAAPKDIFDLKGIDFVAVDIYRNSVADVKYEVQAYASIPGNYALVAENKGTYSYSPSLILTAFANGGGYDIYDLATSKFFLDNTTDIEEVDHGVYTYDLKPREVTEPTKAIVKGIVAAAEDIAVTAPQDFAAFNIAQDQPQQNLNETLHTSGLSVNFATSDGSLAFALDRGSYVVLYSTGNGTFTVNGNFGQKIESVCGSVKKINLQ